MKKTPSNLPKTLAASLCCLLTGTGKSLKKKYQQYYDGDFYNFTNDSEFFSCYMHFCMILYKVIHFFGGNDYVKKSMLLNLLGFCNIRE